MNESVETVREYAMGWEPKDFDEWFKGQGFGEFTRGRAIHQSCWDCGWLAGFKSRDDHITRIERHATALERELAELRAEIAGGAHDSANYPAPEVGLEGHEPGSRNSAVGERVAAPAARVAPRTRAAGPKVSDRIYPTAKNPLRSLNISARILLWSGAARTAVRACDTPSAAPW
jgi:hypothetical protein